MTYEESIAYVAGLEPRGWRLGLDRMLEFAKLAGFLTADRVSSAPQFIHVAGTNGKGSTTAFLQSMMVESGVRTGGFFSPFVVDPLERIQLGRKLISRAEFAAVATDLRLIADQMERTPFAGITEFEFKTGVGFEFWKRQQCQWVALEVGLGGRLDATNIVTPAASIIVSIGLDHVSTLGSTHAEIAREKAGIIKPGVAGVIGRMPPSALEVIESVAAEVDAPLWRMDQEIQIECHEKSVTVTTPLGRGILHPSLFGAVQQQNASLAFAAMQLAGFTDIPALERGAATAFVPGRFQWVQFNLGQRLLLDGAHNSESAIVLSESLKQSGTGKMPCVTGMLAGHEPLDFYGALRDQIGPVFVTNVDYHRTQPAATIANAIRSLGIETYEYENSEAALNAASEFCHRNRDHAPEDILVTGSFYLVGEAMRLAAPRRDAPRDEDA